VGLLILSSLPSHAAAPAVPTAAPNWKLELVASAPTIRHPSVVCTAPDGRVFVAEDPMDITAPADAALGRILCLHSDGRWTVFATNLYAVFGMQYLEGRLYVLHNPKFSVFTDRDGVGFDRIDLIEQTNPNPWALDWNDHVPANFRLAMDGYFYVAIGDKGLFQCRGRDGSIVNLPGGGILRLRPDGTELEVFSTGVRNILDVALDTEDEIFTYDNTDEHQWMGRLTHMVDGGFYGYPHDFIPQRPYTLWMMHDFGAGAACGTLSYNEDALPPALRDNLFLADFGKRQVTRVRIEREGGTFRVADVEELFHDQPEDFRPVGIAFSPDALSLYICDWQHRDTKSKDASVGRLWKLTWTGSRHAAPKPNWYLPIALGQSTHVPTGQLIEGLSHPSHAVRMTAQRALVREAGNPQVRREITNSLHSLFTNSAANSYGRRHALWALDLIDGGGGARSRILSTMNDPDPVLARQAIRQLGNRKAREAVAGLTHQLTNANASIRFQSATALGRIGDTNAVPALHAALRDTDLFARYAAFTALNRIGRAHPMAWPAIVSGLASPEERIREATAFALRETFDPLLVQALIELTKSNEGSPSNVLTREAALRSLASLHHQPPEWRGEWGAYHPAKAPAPERTVVWTGTEPILEALGTALSDSNQRIRLIATEGLGEARATNAAPQLRNRLAGDAAPEVQLAALRALARLRDPETAALIAELIRNASTQPALRVEAIHLAPQFGGADITAALIDQWKPGWAAPELRLAVLESMSRLGGDGVKPVLRNALKRGSPDERRAAIRALGQLRDQAAVPELLVAWKAPETRADALAALSRIADLRALDAYLEGLASADPAVREQCRKALAPIRAEALLQLESRPTPLPVSVVAELRRVYADDAEALNKPLLQSTTKMLGASDYEQYALDHPGDPKAGERVFFNEQGVACVRCHLVSGRGGSVGPDLTLAGSQFSKAQLIESVLYPSRAVREGYQQIVVDTRDEESISGALKADTADGLTLVDASGRTNFVARVNVVDRRTSELSLMPEGLEVGLSPGEFADLIAYLESLKADDRRRSP